MTDFVTHNEVCRRIRDKLASDGEELSGIWVGQDAMYVEYDWALRHGLITQAENDLAHQRYGWRTMHWAGS